MPVASTSRISLLDGFSVHLPDGAHRRRGLEDLPRGVQRLIAHVCLAGRPPRATIAGHLWPDVSEEHAQGSLRSALAAAGRYRDALQAAYAAVRAEPLGENARRTVIGIHLAKGNAARALRAYEYFRSSSRATWVSGRVGRWPDSSRVSIRRCVSVARSSACCTGGPVAVHPGRRPRPVSAGGWR